MIETQGTIAPNTLSFRPQAPEESSHTVESGSLIVSGAGVSQGMAPRGHVLLIGRDTSLQRTRAALLAKVGFRCHLAGEMDEVLRSTQKLFNVIVFCHTLPAAEACQAVEPLQRRFPEAVILRLAIYLLSEEESFEHLLALSSPREFVAMVQHLSLPAAENIA